MALRSGGRQAKDVWKYTHIYIGRGTVIAGLWCVAPLFYVYKTLSAGVELHREFSPVSINQQGAFGNNSGTLKVIYFFSLLPNL